MSAYSHPINSGHLKVRQTMDDSSEIVSKEKFHGTPLMQTVNFMYNL